MTDKVEIPKGKYCNVIKVLEVEAREMAKMYQLYLTQEEGDYWHGRLQEVVEVIELLKRGVK